MHQLPRRDFLPDSLAPYLRLLTLVGFIVGGYCVGLFFFAVIAQFTMGVTLAQVGLLAADPAQVPHGRAALLLMQALSHFTAFTLAAFVMLKATDRDPRLDGWLGQHLRGVSGGQVAAAALVAVVSIPAMSWVIDWNAHVHFPAALRGFAEWARAKEDELKNLTELLTRFDSVADVLVGLVALALIPAIGEELVFRGIVQPSLARMLGGNRHVGVWVTAFVFSAIHVQFFGFVPRLLLGAGFGYLYLWSGRLVVPIAAHFTNNGLQVLLLYAVQHRAVAFDPDSTAALPLPYVLGSLLITGLLFWGLHRSFAALPPPATAAHPFADALPHADDDTPPSSSRA